MVEHQHEREDKYDVDPGWGLPDLTGLLPAGGRFEIAELQLSNTYYDTPSAHLARAGVTLRRRVGGPDAGWCVKVPAGLGRDEITDASDATTLPDELAAVVAGVRAGEELKPVATLTVARTVHRFVSEEGALLVELADDVVAAATLGHESRLSAWREVEVELKPGGDARLLKKIGKALRAAGARRSAYGSKLGRALGPRAGRTAIKPGSAGALVTAYVAAQGEAVVLCDLGLRMGQPEIHKFRVALRRLRSTMRVFGPMLDADRIAQLEPELVWLAGLLGEVRDRDILRERLAQQVADLPPELVLGPVAAHIETTLLLERTEHLDRLFEALDSDRYRALFLDLMSWRTAPPLTKAARKPAAEISRYVRTAERQVVKRLARAGGEVEALHAARKAAKRFRYATELGASVGGRSASKTVRATTELQTLLGEHQDSVVSAAFLRRMGAQAGAGGGQNGFTYGLLLADERHRADRISADAGRRWTKKH